MTDQKSYVYTTDEIKKLTRLGMGATKVLGETRQTYLQALVGTTQAELEGTEDITSGMELSSLKIVNKRFYAAVLEVITTPDLAPHEDLSREEKKRRALERNRRSNFARSSFYIIKSWMTNHSLMELTPAKVTSSGLIEETTTRKKKVIKIKPEEARAKMESLTETLLQTAKQMAPAEGRLMLDKALGAIANAMFNLVSPLEAAAEPLQHTKMDHNGFHADRHPQRQPGGESRAA